MYLPTNLFTYNSKSIDSRDISDSSSSSTEDKLVTVVTIVTAFLIVTVVTVMAVVIKKLFFLHQQKWFHNFFLINSLLIKKLNLLQNSKL